jgi:DNA-directed RNA polymerase subunit alpha
MLTSKSLRLGQLRPDAQVAESEEQEAGEPSVGNEGLLANPVSRIEFSVRVRRALERLNVKTLGELASKTEAELLGCRNFGQTSLNEVVQRLAEYGLRLREPP